MLEGSAGPFNGESTCLSISSRPCSVARSSAIMSVMVNPGPTALSGIPAPAHSDVTDCSRTHSTSPRLLLA